MQNFPPLPQLRRSPWKFVTAVGRERPFVDMSIRFDTVAALDRQTDRQRELVKYRALHMHRHKSIVTLLSQVGLINRSITLSRHITVQIYSFLQARCISCMFGTIYSLPFDVVNFYRAMLQLIAVKAVGRCPSKFHLSVRHIV